MYLESARPGSTKCNIIILTIYCGDFPWYFAYYLHSCQYNPDINFLILSDSGFGGDLPPNVAIRKTTIEEIKQIASDKLGFEVSLYRPYKLCDLKPAYGYILSEYILGYDFWGYCDIDIIFGNIRNFINNELSERYDIISVRHDFLAGYFTLYKNSPLVNELFMQSKDYRKVFSSPEHFCFDECNFLFWKTDEGVRFEDVTCEIDSMTHVVKRCQEKKLINVHLDTYSLQGLGGRLKWEKGILIYKNKYEIMLYHLIKLKEVYERKPHKKMPDSFKISTKRIY